MRSIPMYKKEDLIWAGKDGDFEVEIFAHFIFQLLKQDDELTPKEKQLIKEVDENGTEFLNENQTDLLKKLVSHYEKKCEVCQEEIPLDEVFHLGKYCSYHVDLNDGNK